MTRAQSFILCSAAIPDVERLLSAAQAECLGSTAVRTETKASVGVKKNGEDGRVERAITTTPPDGGADGAVLGSIDKFFPCRSWSEVEATESHNV